MRRTFILPLFFLVSACTPVTPAPTLTPIVPTDVPTSTVTFTADPTATLTPEPTATPEPTKVPMPKGWADVKETQEIGGRQVVTNEDGNAATQIDGEWYPVDVRGCFYKEFFDPEIQKQDPAIMERVEKLNTEPSFIFPDLSNREGGFWPRHAGGNAIGKLKKENLTASYVENYTEGILKDQQLCYNKQMGKWEHTLTFVLVRSEKVTPKDTLVFRGVVGWLENDVYVTFSYLTEAKTFEKTMPFILGPGKKANTLNSGFVLWGDLIEEKKQVGIRIPERLVNGTKLSEEDLVTKLVQAMPETSPYEFSQNIQDPKFVDWLLNENNSVDYYSIKENREDFFTHMFDSWKYWGDQTSEGKIPEPVIRLVIEAQR